MEPCPKCGCSHIGTDVLYSHGVAMFCQKCGHRGPRAPIEPGEELWLTAAEAEAKVQWNEAVLANKLRANHDDLRFSA